MIKDKMITFKEKSPDLDKFLGTSQSTTGEDKVTWSFVLKFNKKEEDAIKESFKDSKYKAMYHFLKDAALKNADFITKKTD